LDPSPAIETANPVPIAGEACDANAGTEASDVDQSNAGAIESPDYEQQPDCEASNGVDDQNIDEWFMALRRDLHQQIISKLSPGVIRSMKEDDLKKEVRRQVEAICDERAELLNADERERLVTEILDETFGLGPLEQILRDEAISDILINGPKNIYIEKGGRLSKSPVVFVDEKHLLQVVQRIVGKVGRRIDETSPLVDARLPDGSRVNAAIAPIALDGSLVSIRRFGKKPLLAERLVEFQSITEEMLQFLTACVQARLNVIISGGTGSGKTTLLNALSRYIPGDERVATIEDAAELRLQQDHVVRMETRPANVEGNGEISTRDLVRNALRMRPDRIIVGECRGSEALDMLQAMNTGHDGSITTIHANTPRDALSRLEMMVGMAGFELPIWVIRKQVASAVQIIIQASRLIGGVRKITKISEVTGMEGDVVSLQDIFEFKQTGLDENRVAQGHFLANGIRPACLEKLEACGVPVPFELFERRKLQF
jgi:pilus assembly protein CpaF